MSKPIKKKLLSGFIWSFVEKIFVKGASFIIGIILARLLSPSDYGLIGMLAVFVSLSNVIIESGFSKALVQKIDCNDIDYSTVFYSNIAISLLIYVILFVSAPWISQFYNEPLLIDILRVLALNFVLGALNIVQRAKLTRSMDFKSLAKINFTGVIAGGVLGISMAYIGFGVWSLVGQTLANSIVLIIIFPVYSKWRPRLIFSKDSFANLFGFGSKLMFTGVVATIVNNISTISIGKFYKSAELGFYTRATQFSELVAYTIHDVIGTVSFPALTQLQDERERLISVYRKTLFYLALLIFPVMILMALLAKPLVIILLTDKWLPCVLMLQILCFARMFTPLSAVNMNIVNAIGRSDLFMKIDFVKIPMMLITLAITIPIGVEAIVWGNLATTIVSFFINTYYPKKLFNYGAMDQLFEWRYIIVSLSVMVLSVLVFLHFVTNPWVQLLGGGFGGIIVYVLFCFKFNIINVETLKSLKK